MPSASPPPADAPCGRHAAVVVLGELCQSPRMVAHARELLAAGWSVDVLGYGDAPDAVAFAAGLDALPGMRVVRLRSFATGRYRSALLAAPLAALRVLLLFLHTLWALVVRTRRAPDVILAQTPPALPTLLAVPLAALFVRARLGAILDWHNVGATLLPRAIGRQRVLFALAALLERRLARLATRHMAVSRALAAWLADAAGVRAAVVYDRPDPRRFRRLGGREAGLVRARTCARLAWAPGDEVLAVSPTSWTPDEDFGVLLAALDELEDRLAGRRCADCAAKDGLSCAAVGNSNATQHPRSSETVPAVQSGIGKAIASYGHAQSRTEHADSALRRQSETGTVADFQVTRTGNVILDAPRISHPTTKPHVQLSVVITGRGPGRAAFEAAVRSRAYARVRVGTLWLPAFSEYAALLGAADAGLSLHASSSGLDLPMKVVDMLAAGVPRILARDYPALGELLGARPGAAAFADAHQLCDRLADLVGGGRPADVRRCFETWREHWTAHALPLFEGRAKTA